VHEAGDNILLPMADGEVGLQAGEHDDGQLWETGALELLATTRGRGAHLSQEPRR